MIECSIIIVNYNNFNLLDDCISSIIRFTQNINYEIIVVDNNSTCGNIEEVVNKYPCTRLIVNKENRGFSAANNQGVEAARGEYILFLNNDTIFLENSIGNVLSFVKSKDEDFFVGCKLLNKDRSHQVSFFNFPSVANVFSTNFFIYKIFPDSPVFNKYHLSRKQIIQPVEVDVILGAFILCPARTIKKLNGFDERFFFYSEEIDLCYRLKKNGGKIYYYPLTNIIHLGGASADQMPWFQYKNRAISDIKFYQKHFHGLKYAFVILLHYIGLIIRIPITMILGILLMKRQLLKKSFVYIRQLFVYPKNVYNH
ncbi:MAG: glycosyltransferase family 2 protein [Syntrophomonadaceae bacterium]